MCSWKWHVKTTQEDCTHFGLGPKIFIKPKYDPQTLHGTKILTYIWPKPSPRKHLGEICATFPRPTVTPSENRYSRTANKNIPKNAEPQEGVTNERPMLASVGRAIFVIPHREEAGLRLASHSCRHFWNNWSIYLQTTPPQKQRFDRRPYSGKAMVQALMIRLDFKVGGCALGRGVGWLCHYFP